MYRCWWGIGEVVVNQIIKDDNSMCIQISVKHLQTFRESWIRLSNMTRAISNMYTYTYFEICIHNYLTQNWWQKHKLKAMMRNRKIKETFIPVPPFSKWMVVSQALLDYFFNYKHLLKILLHIQCLYNGVL